MVNTSKTPKLLDVINDTTSTVRLQCIRGHIVNLGYISTFLHNTISYRTGIVLPRNCIFLKPGHWKIAAKKHQK